MFLIATDRILFTTANKIIIVHSGVRWKFIAIEMKEFLYKRTKSQPRPGHSILISATFSESNTIFTWLKASPIPRKNESRSLNHVRTADRFPRPSGILKIQIYPKVVVLLTEHRQHIDKLGEYTAFRWIRRCVRNVWEPGLHVAQHNRNYVTRKVETVSHLLSSRASNSVEKGRTEKSESYVQLLHYKAARRKDTTLII